MLSYSYGPFPAPGWPYVAPPSQGPITISDNSVTNSGAFGIGVELTQQTSEETTTPSVSVTGNAVDNSLSGAVGLMVDQGTYLITGNTFTGTTLTGSSGSSQPTGQGVIATASIQVLDAYDSVTQAFVGGNDYVGTTLYTALLNVTTPPQVLRHHLRRAGADGARGADRHPNFVGCGSGPHGVGNDPLLGRPPVRLDMADNP